MGFEEVGRSTRGEWRLSADCRGLSLLETGEVGWCRWGRACATRSVTHPAGSICMAGMLHDMLITAVTSCRLCRWMTSRSTSV
jgi:hypothetical protein